MYTYYADLVEVIDGDTYVMDWDLGRRTWANSQHFRLAGYSCRERSMPGGPECRDHVTGLMPSGTRVVIRSIKVDHDPADVASFERYVVHVQLPDGRDLGHLLEQEGWAVPWNGHTRPVPYPLWPIPTGER